MSALSLALVLLGIILLISIMAMNFIPSMVYVFIGSFIAVILCVFAFLSER